MGRNSGRGRVAQTCFLGTRLFLVHRGRAADLKDRSALRLLNTKDLRVEFLQRSRGGPEPCEGRISHCLENTQSAILRVVYPERQSEILRCALNESERAQDDSRGAFSAACEAPPFHQPGTSEVRNAGEAYNPIMVMLDTRGSKPRERCCIIFFGTDVYDAGTPDAQE